MPKNSQNVSFAQYSMRDFFYVLFRHKGKMILFFLAVMMAVTAGTFLSTEVFRSEAKLMVRIGRESATLDPTVATTGQVMQVSPSRESEINSEIEILKSRELVERVVDAIGPKAILEGPEGTIGSAASVPGLKNLPQLQNLIQETKKNLADFLLKVGIGNPLPERDKAIIQFRKNFTVEVLRNTNILAVTYEGPGYGAPQNILSKMIDFFLEKHIVAHRTEGSYEFFQKQSDQLRNQMLKAEEELTKLKTQTGVASLEEQRRILMTRAGTLQQENEATQSALAISRAKVQELKANLARLSPTIVTTETKGTGNYAADMMRARLYELQLREQDLLSKYTENNQMVQEVRRQILEARTLLDKEEPTRTQVTTGINTAYEQLNLELTREIANLSSLEAKAAVLKTQQEAARSELTELNHMEAKMIGLQRQLALLESKYRKYSENMEQARIDQALLDKKITNISIVQAPTQLPEPVKPRKALNIALGVLVGLLGGIALTFYSEYFDHSLKKPQDVVEKLNLPILASIPVLKKLGSS
jgi:uncharacterized protein involved in exopolysaccharide biosynthesis